jgi:hypothetical protein
MLFQLAREEVSVELLRLQEQTELIHRLTQLQLLVVAVALLPMASEQLMALLEVRAVVDLAAVLEVLELLVKEMLVEQLLELVVFMVLAVVALRQSVRTQLAQSAVEAETAQLRVLLAHP